ncbi:hypothetical protein DCAR_0521030 [Daucus carota subsp. sativus]|uniref:Uncharacterized protein n=1 Tax=Daucus carota subsp. sativus TaxID=79200 RepID=A0A164Z0V2_DAUCS|nr:hypothetical protein DCAR_0521030 [Daucus carota subsp. sativus]
MFLQFTEFLILIVSICQKPPLRLQRSYLIPRRSRAGWRRKRLKKLGTESHQKKERIFSYLSHWQIIRNNEEI